jgi:hypothetical protein
MNRHALVRSNFAWLLALSPLIGGCGTPFKTQQQMTLTAPTPITELSLENSVGAVHLRGDASAKEVKAEIIKVGKGLTQAESEQALKDIEVEFGVRAPGGALLAKANRPEASAFRNYEVHWRITAPPDATINIRNHVGDVRVEGFAKDVMVTSDVGDVTIQSPESGNTAPVTVKLGVGSVQVSRAASGLNVQTDVGSVSAICGGAVEIRTDVGDVRVTLLSENPGNVKIATDVGDVTLNIPLDRKGRLDADTDVGDVDLHMPGIAMKEVRHKSHHLSATLGDASEPTIDISTDVGDAVIRQR